MLKNYFKIAFRNIVRQKGYSFINIAGLAVGIASCILIFLYVQDELKYDHHHKNGKDIYRIAFDAKIGDQELNHPNTPAPMGFTMVDEIPEVYQSARFFKPGRFLIQYQDNRYNEARFLFADSTVFKVFTIPMVLGDPDKALTQPHTIVITEEIADKYFGDENPMDKYLTMEDGTDYMVTGVVKTPPRHSHIEFDFLASMISMGDFSRDTWWLSNNFYTYILLNEGTPYQQAEDKLDELVTKYAGPQLQMALGVSFTDFLESGSRWRYYLEPLFDIYLHSDLESQLGGIGNSTYVNIFSIVAIFILLIACINFINLATARSTNRAKEVGIRKVLGSEKKQLIFQFITESILLTFIATIFAVIFVELLIPAFNNLIGKVLVFSLINSGISIPAILGFVIVIGISAGVYPAFFLAAFKPIFVLQGQASKGMKSGKLRNGLVIFQFTISIILFIGTLVVYGQLNYFQNKNMGFVREQVLVIPRADVLEEKGEVFRQELLQYSQITHASFSSTLPGKGFANNGHRPKDGSADLILTPAIIFVDENFIETYKIEMAGGRFFSNSFSTDTTAVILNETAVRDFQLEDPLGQIIVRIGLTPDESVNLNIVGVVKDFHFRSLHKQIEPMLIKFLDGTSSYLSLRILTEDIQETIAFVEDKWREFVPDKIFEYYFFDDDYNRLYMTEQRMGNIFTIFSALAIFIAGLGLFGLASFTAEQRSKEIGVRKVLGASVKNIIVLLSKETLIMVIISTIVAWPVAYYFMNRWLQDFAYRINLSLSTFILSSLAALCIGLITISYQAVKAATANPVEALKYE